MAMDISSRLKVLRFNAGLTQAEMAQRMHADQSTVSDWERGKKLPSAKMLIRLSDVLGVTVDEILAGQPAQSLSA